MAAAVIGQTVTVLRPGAVDKWGQRTTSVSHQISGCVIAPRSSQEGGKTQVAQDSVNTVVTGLTLYAPYGSDLEPTDVVQLTDGSKWHVLGDVGSWMSPFTGWRAGIEASLERVTG